MELKNPRSRTLRYGLLGGVVDQLDVQTCGAGCDTEGRIVQFDTDRGIVFL